MTTHGDAVGPAMSAAPTSPNSGQAISSPSHPDKSTGTGTEGAREPESERGGAAVKPAPDATKRPATVTETIDEPAEDPISDASDEPTAGDPGDEPPAAAGAVEDEPGSRPGSAPHAPTADEQTVAAAEDEPAADEPTVAEDEPTAVVPGEPAAAAEDEPTADEPTVVAAGEEPAAAAVADEPTAVVPADKPAAADEPTVVAVEDEAVLGSPTPVEPPAAVGRLAAALSRLRAAIGGASYPLVMPSADDARRVGKALVSQLDDYLLPRLARLDAPLLVVVGGSTGAGKSTLVNSLVRAPVSAAGVLRPTTRSPVLVSHPGDLPWFRKGELLPGLTRTSESSSDPQTLQLVAAPALGAGLAFLDAPDIDSVVDRNRQLAAQLLAAADLWLFVTTAARYADAVPWELLKTARLRGTVIALVLNRVPPEAAGEISAHLGEMLAGHDMAAAPLFVLPETTLDGQGLLSESVIKPLHDWFGQLAADVNARTAVVRQTLDGALSALRPAVDGLADATDDQRVAANALEERVTVAYRHAKRTVEEGLKDGRLLRGEVLARWQEFVGTGEFLRTLESKVGQLRDRMVAAITGRPAPGKNLQTALESQLVTLLRGVAADAAEQAYSAWQAHPAGAALLEPALQHPAKDLPQRADRLVRDWQQWVLDLVRSEAGDKRFVARAGAYAVNGVGLAVMIAVFTSTAFIPTGAELAVGAGTTVAAQKLLEAIFGDQAIRTLAARAREELLTRVNALLDAEAARFGDRIAAVGLELEPGTELRHAAEDVERARGELALTAVASPLAVGKS